MRLIREKGRSQVVKVRSRCHRSGDGPSKSSTMISRLSHRRHESPRMSSTLGLRTTSCTILLPHTTRSVGAKTRSARLRLTMFSKTMVDGGSQPAHAIAACLARAGRGPLVGRLLDIVSLYAEQCGAVGRQVAYQRASRQHEVPTRPALCARP